MRILIVEDDHLLQKVLSRLLAGHDLTVVDRVEAAIELLQGDGSQPEAVLSDYNLAGDLTGGDLLEWVKENRPKLVDSFVFCSANETVAGLHHRTIQKPFRWDELRKAFPEQRPQ